MTRKLLTLTLLTGTLLVCTLIVGPSPVTVAGAALGPETARTSASAYSLDVRVGDGIFQLRIRSCETCQTSVTIELRLPRLLGNPAARARTSLALQDSPALSTPH